MNILAIQSNLSKTYLRRISRVIQANRKKKTKKDPDAPKGNHAHPTGSKNRDKTQVDLTPDLKRIQSMVQKQLEMIQDVVMAKHLTLDRPYGILLL
jgi:hypothetical protein